MATQLERKEETRRRMLDAAGRQFRSRGYAGIGVAGIAETAGVTTGALYAHFGSKDGAFLAALGAGLDEVIEAVPAFQARHGAGWLSAFAAYYLGKPHRDDRECGCAMTALTPDVVRSDATAKSVYSEKMNRIADLMAEGLAGGSKAEKRAQAWRLLSLFVGGLTLARAAEDGPMSQEIEAAVRATADAAETVVKDQA